MAIQNPSALATQQKKIRILIAGYPGIGKSTVALSAPNPLHIDVDRGIDRVEARYRKPFIQPMNYNELLDDLRKDNPALSHFETLVFDTGGQLIKLMGSWAIKQNAQNGQRDGSLSLKGYGAIGREFERLMSHCYYELNKHIVVLFHAKEEKEGDNTRLRLLVEGQTRDNVWQPMDLGGFMEMQNNTRTVGFTNCERYYAKGTHGIKGIHKIPELTPTEKVPFPTNNFLSSIFDKVNQNIADEAEAIERERADYETVMYDVQQIVSSVTSLETANEAVQKITEMNHILTSAREAKSLLVKRTKELGFVYDSKEGVYRCVS